MSTIRSRKPPKATPQGRRPIHGSEGGPPIQTGEPDRLQALEERLSNRTLIAGGIAAVALLGAIVLAVTLVAVARDVNTEQQSVEEAAAEPDVTVHKSSGETGLAPAPAADDPAAEGVEFEPYQWADPSLPAPPSGAVKRFTVDVYEHVTRVSDDLAPTRVWSYAVNGADFRGTGVSAPIVVNEGDDVEMTLRNGSSKAMHVHMPHSIDFHSSEVAPNVAFATIEPGETHKFSFVAKHPGVFMYHCATQPVLQHTAAGMVGMMVVKPAGLPPVDRELWINQQEFYLGPPGADADYNKAQAKAPDVVAFNGYANQYMDRKPVPVKRGETVRMYVLNSGPSLWSAFHVIGTVFDKVVTDNGRMHDVQTINLAPSQGGYVEFTLDKEGTYPFVTHSFGDMEKGAAGVLATEHAESGVQH